MASLHRQLDALQSQLAGIRKRLDDSASGEGVFVVGCPRSGTSALSWAIAQHPAFATGPESNFLHALVTSRAIHHAYERGTVQQDGWLRTSGVDYAEFAASFGFGVHSLLASRARGRRWVDSSTENLLIAEELSVMLPGARFVHIVRDGRAVVASLLSSGFGQPWTKDFEIACRTWVAFIAAGEAFRKTHPEKMLQVRNETIAEDCKGILAFLGEEQDARVAGFLQKRRINSSYSSDGELRKREEAWKSWPEEQLEIFDQIAGNTLRRMGYGSDGQ